MEDFCLWKTRQVIDDLKKCQIRAENQKRFLSTEELCCKIWTMKVFLIQLRKIKAAAEVVMCKLNIFGALLSLVYLNRFKLSLRRRQDA